MDSEQTRLSTQKQPEKQGKGLQNRIVRLFDEFFDTNTPMFKNWDYDAYLPTTEVEEGELEYSICMDVPGVSKEQVKVEIDGERLVIFGERRDEHTERGRGRRFTERSYGSFHRSFSLPRDVALDQIQAECSNGVLRIRLPKSAGQGTRKIRIDSPKSGDSKKSAA